MGDKTRLRLAQSHPALPVDPLVNATLGLSGGEAQHEQLVVAWEAALRIAAIGAWSVCRHLGLTSGGLAQSLRSLKRPSLGHWVGLLREATALLRAANDRASDALSPLLDGLSSPYAEHSDLQAFAELFDSAGARVQGKSTQDLLQAVPNYRNRTQSTHHGIEPGFRASAAPRVRDALLALCERAPLLGAYRLVVVHQLSRDEGGHKASVAVMHGAGPVMEELELQSEHWAQLERGQAYLALETNLWIPLSPLVTAREVAGRYQIGWIEGRVRKVTLSYQTSIDGSFQAAVAKSAYSAVFDLEEESAEVTLSGGTLEMDPWIGLPAYSQEQRELFFGREEETAAALSRLDERGALVMCGPSGSGKSSLMQAGLLPGWIDAKSVDGLVPVLLQMRPGARALEALEETLSSALDLPPERLTAWAREVRTALRGDDPDGLVDLLRGLTGQGRPVLLAVDQFEEAVTLTGGPEGKHFVNLVARAALRAREISARVVLTVRTDLLGSIFTEAAARELVAEHLFPLGAIDSERAERIIVGPLQGRNTEIEAGLPELVARDVGDGSGSLALLSQVMATLWQERGSFGYKLTKAGYEAAGRVTGALRYQADHALAESTQAPDSEANLERLLLLLVTLNVDGSHTRRRPSLAELEDALSLPQAGIEALLGPFVERRLIVRGQSSGGGRVVELAHEALITGWPHLAELVSSQAGAIELRQHVQAAAAAWVEAGQRGELWTDSTTRLGRAEELLQAGRLQLGESERNFLVASRRAVTKRRRLERTVAVILVVLLVAAGLLWRRAQSATAVAQQAAADEHAAKVRAQRAELAERGERALALARVPGRELDALAAGVLAFAGPDDAEELPVTHEAVLGLTTALTAAEQVRTLPGHEGRVTSAAFSPDGKLVLTSSYDGGTRVWDAQSGAPVAELRLASAARVDVAMFSPNGDLVASSDQKGNVGLWKLGASPELRLQHNLSGKRVRDLDLTDTWLAAAASANEVQLWSTIDGTATTLSLRELFSELREGEAVVAKQVRFVGEHLYVVVQRGAKSAARDHLVAVRPGKAEAPRLVPIGEWRELKAAASVDRSTLVLARRAYAGGQPHTSVVAVDHEGRESGLVEDVFEQWGDARWQALGPLAASRDGRRVALTPRGSETAAVVDRREGRSLGAFATDTKIRSLRFSSHDRLAASAASGLTRVWDLSSAQTFALPGHKSDVWSVGFDPTGERVVTASNDRSARVWNLSPRALAGEMVHDDPANSPYVMQAAFSGDGDSLATASWDGTARLWRSSDLQQLAAVAHRGWVGRVAFSPKGDFVASGGKKTSGLMLWRPQSDTDARDLLPKTEGAAYGNLRSLGFSKDGVWLAAGLESGELKLWRVGTDAAPTTLFSAKDSALKLGKVWALDFAEDASGTRLLAAGEAGVAVLISKLDGGVETTQLGETGNSPILNAIFSPDATKALIGYKSGLVVLQDLKTGQARELPAKHKDWVRGLAFSPDGARFVSAGDETALLWDLQGQQLAKLVGHEDDVTSVEFSHDGKYIVTSSADGTARVWAADTGHAVELLRGHTGQVVHATFHPKDSSIVVTTSYDGTARKWKLRGRSIEESLATACELLGADHDAAASAACHRFAGTPDLVGSL